MITINERLAQQAIQWLKVPYVHRGTTRRGCDCTGLLIGCLQEMGYLSHYKLRLYPRDWNMHAMAGDYIQEEIGVVADKVDGLPQRGDIVLFRFGKCVAHCGIVIKKSLFIHSHVHGGKVEYGLLTMAKWTTRLVAVWRLNEQKLEATR